MFHQSRRTLIYATPPYCHYSRQKLIECSLSFRQSSRHCPCCTRTCLHGQCGSPNIWPLGSRPEDRVFTANCRRSLRTYRQTDVVTLAVTEVMFIYLMLRSTPAQEQLIDIIYQSHTYTETKRFTVCDVSTPQRGSRLRTAPHASVRRAATQQNPALSSRCRHRRRPRQL